MDANSGKALDPIELIIEGARMNTPLGESLIATGKALLAKEEKDQENELENNVEAFISEKTGQLSMLKVGLFRDENGDIILDAPDEQGRRFPKARKSYIAYNGTRTSKDGTVRSVILFKAMHGNRTNQPKTTTPNGEVKPIDDAVI